MTKIKKEKKTTKRTKVKRMMSKMCV